MKQISYDERDPISPDQRARMKMLHECNTHIDPCTGIEGVVKKVIEWHYERNLIEGSSDKDQLLKLLEEMAELSDSVVNNRDIKDDIGDMLVVMLNICERNKIKLYDCLVVAYNDIKDRKGKMVDGIFVKEED
jgi:NTP pyrophosphatase (non-canonical NTP hydrolase)